MTRSRHAWLVLLRTSRHKWIGSRYTRNYSLFNTQGHRPSTGQSRGLLRLSVVGGASYGFVASLLTAKDEKDGNENGRKKSDHDNRDTDSKNDENATGKQLHVLEEKEKSSWHGLNLLKQSLSVNSISSTMSTWTWPTTFDFSAIQGRFSTLLLELGQGPGSLYSEIVYEPPDPDIYPEIEWDAEVRLGEELCIAERSFLHERKRKMKSSFAKLMGLPERSIDERDLPMVAIAGSGGGYRAMLNTIGSLVGADSSGVLPCVAYTAGVSGSCWAISVLYSGVAGSQAPQNVAQHIKARISTSYLDTDTLDALTNPPTNKYLLSSILRKAAGPTSVASLVDVYGTLLSSRIFIPDDLSKLDQKHLSLHLLRRHIDNGQLPLPIFTAIQHAATTDTMQAIREVEAEKAVSIDSSKEATLGKVQEQLQSEVRCLWYEFTPYEVGCDELGAWIPSWALGRQFKNGKNTDRRPEVGLTILTGIFGSAFCASLKLYFREIQPTLRLLPSQLYDWLENIVTENERDLELIHPVLPDQLPNFLKGLDGQLRDGSPPDVVDWDYMSFMDAGADLNIPYYPLLRRGVDCIIALDASADSQDLWFTRAEELAAKRGLRTWPKGAGWPTGVQSTLPFTDSSSSVSPQTTASAEDAANLKLAQTQESALAQQTGRQESTEEHGIPDRSSHKTSTRKQPLSSCEVWIGSSHPTEAGSSRLDDLDEDALLQRDGIGVVYIPLGPNERREPGFDPSAISTWRREVTPEESQSLLNVAEANFVDSREKIVRLLRAIWLRKKREREKREWKDNLERFRKNLRKGLL